MERSFQVKNRLPINEINNYFSIGIDAKIALDSHEARGKEIQSFRFFFKAILTINNFIFSERNPEKFTSPNYNKVVYSKVNNVFMIDYIFAKSAKYLMFIF